MKELMVKGKLNIGLDLDGVIIDHTQNAIKVARGLGFKITKEDSHAEVLKRIMPKDSYENFKKAIYGKLSIYARPMPYALPSIKRLANAGHTLSIISRRLEDKKYALSWLKDKGIMEYIPRKRIIFVGDDSQKSLFAKDMGIDVFLDDKIEVLSYMENISYPVLFNALKLDINNDQYREVGSWKEFFTLVDTRSL